MYMLQATPKPTPSTDFPWRLSQSLAVEGQDRAVPWGYELSGRAWVPSVPYVGGHVRVRQVRYSIASSAFANDALDWLYQVQGDLTGRYPFELGTDTFWVGAKAGLHFNDFMVFTGCLDPGCEVSYDPLGLLGLGLGPELGAELGPIYLIASYTQGFAKFSIPYSAGVDVNVGWQATDALFFDVGMSTLSRRLALEGEDSGLERGQLSDGLTVFQGGIGFSL